MPTNSFFIKKKKIVFSLVWTKLRDALYNLIDSAGWNIPIELKRTMEQRVTECIRSPSLIWEGYVLLSFRLYVRYNAILRWVQVLGLLSK